MFRKIFSTAMLLLSAFCFSINAQTEDKTDAKPVLNDAAKYLPKPVYPQEAKDACADGLVNVEVSLDENGDVISAVAVSGDEPLRDSAVEAAKKAKFKQVIDGGEPVKVKGIIVYNFVPEKKCVKAGIVNKKALSIPKPKLKNARYSQYVSKEETVQVQVIIDHLTGEVKKATVISGHPFFHAACVNSALKAKFPPFYHGAGILVKAIIVYKFKPDGTVDTNIDKTGNSQSSVKKITISCGQCISKAIFLAKPEYPKAAKAVRALGSVSVEILVDEKGNVESAKVKSGHPLLWIVSEKAALKSKFEPKLIGGNSVRFYSTIVYNFVSQ